MAAPSPGADAHPSPGVIALNRFGLGARPGDAASDWRAWLTAQIADYDPRPTTLHNTASSEQVVAEYRELRERVGQAADEAARQKARMELNRIHRGYYREAVAVRITSALVTEAPFAERLVHFWSNHFALSGDKAVVLPFLGAFELEAIRPNIMGKFEDLLLAVERHPGMLLYLDQAGSVGPNSPLASRAAANNRPRIPGLNENLSREIMELHTLGVRTGYTQSDVTELARALTGWTIAGFGPGAARMPSEGTSPFLFRPALHEPGTRTILGRLYGEAGEAQAQAILHDLAYAPATATHIATKLARHFVADDPPSSLVERLASVFIRSRGDLAAVYQALISADEAWSPAPTKFKTPWEWAVSALRGIGGKPSEALPVQRMLAELGQAVWQPGSPAGWDDLAASWAAPNALYERVELADRMARLAPDNLNPRELAETLLPGGSITPATRAVMESADTRQTALALLLVSPEFLRR